MPAPIVLQVQRLQRLLLLEHRLERIRHLGLRRRNRVPRQIQIAQTGALLHAGQQLTELRLAEEAVPAQIKRLQHLVSLEHLAEGARRLGAQLILLQVQLGAEVVVAQRRRDDDAAGVAHIAAGQIQMGDGAHVVQTLAQRPDAAVADSNISEAQKTFEQTR